jgi:hypothetical protein
VTVSAGHLHGDVEIREYLRDAAGSRSLVFDLSIVHDRFGSSTHVQQNRAISPKTKNVCVFYYCRTYYKAVRVGGGGEWRTCAMRDDEPRPVWMSLPITH